MADKDKNQSEETVKSSETEATGEVEQSQETEGKEKSSAQQAGSEAQEEKKEVEKNEPSGASTTDEPAPKAKPVSKDLEDIISKIEKLSVLELADLVHALEDRFGVTAAAPIAVAATGAAPAGSGEAVEEQTTFNVILASAGANKIAVIKAVRELVPTLGLKEAKDLVEAAPKPVMEGVNKEKANEAKTKLTAAGATVELQ